MLTVVKGFASLKAKCNVVGSFTSSGKTLLSIHNVNFLLKLASDIRQAIKEDRLLDFKEEFLDKYGHDVYKRAF